MITKKNKGEREIVLVFGTDHTNTVGVCQSLGKAGYNIVALLFGIRKDIVSACKYVGRICWGENGEDCVRKILSNQVMEGNNTPIICCCDKAALLVNEYGIQLKEKGFLHEHTTGPYPFATIFAKDLQVKLAIESGFNVPKSWELKSLDEIPEAIVYPCLIKPLVSCHGAKSDIRICKNREELDYQFNTLEFTDRVLLQQYIERDYEISVIGCVLKDGECVIPAVEDKLSLWPRYVGLECLANVHPLEDKDIISSIKNLIKKIGYVGVFSVEMMHCRLDNKFYFTEINLRNDGAQSFIFKYGVNLPAIHVCDLLDKPLPKAKKTKPGYYIWDVRHFALLRVRDISAWTWLKEICKSRGFLMFYWSDPKPFFRQYRSYYPIRFIRRKLHKNTEHPIPSNRMLCKGFFSVKEALISPAENYN